MWSGRFREPLDAEFEAWQRSIVFDWRLLDQEIAASKAHASALLRGRNPDNRVKTTELREGARLRSPPITHPTRARRWCAIIASAEDIHHFVELKLVERIGSLGLKLHTGRSRNEQIATDLRLYVREQIELVIDGLAAWAEALVEQARSAGDAVMPSYTHLQRAEPVLVAHWLLAYVEMALRDASRFADCAARLNYCPLGSGAVAGATLALDRTIAAHELGFTAPTANSMDATSDRDFILEYLQALTFVGLHLSRFAEEITLFATAEFGFVDSARGIFDGLERHAAEEESRSDRVDSRQSRPHSSARRRPSRCSSKACLWPTIKTCRRRRSRPLQSTLCRRCCKLVARFTAALEFNRERMSEAAQSGYLNAMAAATYLVHKGVPFRTRTKRSAMPFALRMEKGVELDELDARRTAPVRRGVRRRFFRGDHA